MPPENDSFRHEYAQINGLRYHYVRQGSGPPLLLVHGWPGFMRWTRPHSSTRCSRTGYPSRLLA